MISTEPLHPYLSWLKGAGPWRAVSASVHLTHSNVWQLLDVLATLWVPIFVLQWLVDIAIDEVGGTGILLSGLIGVFIALVSLVSVAAGVAVYGLLKRAGAGK